MRRGRSRPRCPAGYVASRFGPRRTVIWGLCRLGVASFLFGILESAWPLDAARFIQGIAGALIWSGALTWMINGYPEDKRGQVIGTALGTAVAGSLLGPALGALAASIGTEPSSAPSSSSPSGSPSSPRAFPTRWCARTSRCARSPLSRRPAAGRGGDLRQLAVADVRRDRRAAAAAGGRPRRRPRVDRGRLHRRRRDRVGVLAARRPYLRPGRPARPLRARDVDLRGADGLLRARRLAGDGDLRPASHLARLRASASRRR